MPHLTPGLNADETAQLNSLITEMRSLVLDLSHVVQHARVIDDAMQAYGNELLAKVEDNAEIENVTGLAGAQDLFATEVSTLLARIATLNAMDVDADRQLFIKSIGAHNVRERNPLPPG